MRINSNIPALTAFNSLTTNTNSLQKAMQQVSTGLRINSAADDAAGLAISDHIHAQSLGLERAMLNTQDGISLLQTAEGALGSTNSMLQRMRELAVQAANDTLTSQDRSYLQMEIDELRANIDKVASSTQFNTKSLLDGSLCGSWSSTDNAVKAYIRGAIETEGNYRIEVKANPGAAQVQKSSIFKVKHENVVTNLQLNTADGFGGMSIDGLPAGDYSISTSMGAGGDVKYKYASTIEGEVTEANESGAKETMTLTFHGKDSDTTGSIDIALAADDTDPEKVAQKIAQTINSKGKITIGDKEFTLSAVQDGSKYTITATGFEEVDSLASSVKIDATAAISSITNSRDPETWSVVNVPNRAGADVAGVTISYNGMTQNLSGWSSGTSAKTMAEDIQAALKGAPFNIADTFIASRGTGENSQHYVWIEQSGPSPTIMVTTMTSWSAPYGGRGSLHKINSSGSINSGNTSSEEEKITLTIQDYDTYYSPQDTQTLRLLTYQSLQEETLTKYLR